MKGNIKAPRHWPLCGEFTGDRWIPRTKGPVTRKMFPFDDVIMIFCIVVVGARGQSHNLGGPVAMKWHSMMTSLNGNIFRVTGHLCGEFTGPVEFPAQRPVTRSFDGFFFICFWINGWENNREAGDLRRNLAHYDVIIMRRIWIESFGTKIRQSACQTHKTSICRISSNNIHRIYNVK